MFRIETGEMRGKVPIMTDPAGLAIDPSGLYLAVAVRNNSIDPEQGLRRRWNLQGYRTNVDGSRTRVIFYELCTGVMSAEISCLFDISAFAFSPNGKFFVAGSRGGCVSIWAVADHLVGNISRVLAQLEMNPNFWSAYPIFIKNQYVEDLQHFEA